jgi:L-malate glycosyltransferase
MKLNILILTYQGDYSGATNSISYLAKGLADAGHTVYVGCRK